MVSSNSRIMSATPFSDILQQFLNKNDKQTEFKEHSAIVVFKEMLPQMYHPYIRKIKCTNGVLFVQITNAALKFDLMMQRTTYIKNINAKLGSEVVKDILLK